MASRPTVICLDMEGVLTPEIWIHVAEATGIESLKRTTRDEPNYDVLMKGRLEILKQNKLTLKDIQAVIAQLEPLDGAVEFIDALRGQAEIVLLSDTFYQFAGPLIEKMKWPTLFCNKLEIGQQGEVLDYHLRQPDQKRESVRALKGLNFQVLAAGDSYNDLSMLKEADLGVLFRPPETILNEYRDFPVTHTHRELYKCCVDFIQRG